MTAYLKEDIPDWLHYKNNEFIQPILLVADEGWTIVQRGDKPNHCMDLCLKWCNACWVGCGLCVNSISVIRIESNDQRSISL